MNREDFIAHSLRALEDAVSQDDLAAVIYDMRDHFQVANLTYRSLRPVGTAEVEAAAVISTSHPDWFRLYDSNEFIAIDPILHVARRAALPLDWDDVDRRSRHARHYFSEMMRFRIGDRGVSIPLSPPGRTPGVFTFMASGLSDRDWQLLRRRCEADMVFLGQHIHFHALRISRTQGINVTLTERGRACLELVLNGHKPAPIGKLLGLSVYTVRMHLRHAQERLECHSLPEAVGKALELGIIKKHLRLIPIGFAFDLLSDSTFFDFVTSVSG